MPMFDEKLPIKLDTAPELIKRRWKVMKIKSVALVKSCQDSNLETSVHIIFSFSTPPPHVCTILHRQPLFLSLLR